MYGFITSGYVRVTYFTHVQVIKKREFCNLIQEFNNLFDSSLVIFAAA